VTDYTGTKIGARLYGENKLFFFESNTSMNPIIAIDLINSLKRALWSGRTGSTLEHEKKHLKLFSDG
jgi:hypothetical protein